MTRCPRALAFLVAAVLAGAAHAAPDAPLRVQLRWLHQAQFAGYYEADARDPQRDAFDLVEGGPGIDPLARLAKGEVDVAIGWLAEALEARTKGSDIVNVAQVFRRPGMAMACLRSAGVRVPADVKGRDIGVWNVGDQISVHLWLDRQRIAASSVRLVPQAANAQDLISGKVPCATVMLYNEYWTVLRSGIAPADLMMVRFSEEGLGMLEDGLYVRRASLDDPEFRRKLAVFVKASAVGWRQARENPEEAITLTLAQAPALDASHQRRMLEAILNLIPADKPFGLLSLTDFDRSVDILTSEKDAASFRRAAAGAWTHAIWYEAGVAPETAFTESTRQYLAASVSSTWFYVFDLIGTAAFGVAGFMRARQRRYDLWGAFVLTSLPAVGGGTLRDLLIGGDRSPPFIFQDPTYMYVVMAVVAVGTLCSRFMSTEVTESKRFNRALAVFDTIGLATFTVVGAKVALMAGLAWYWVPICAAITCSGGGMLLDVVTGREPRTFQGELYESIAIAGGLLLYAGLKLANDYEHSPWLVTGSIVLTWCVVYAARMTFVLTGARSFRLGDEASRRGSARRQR